MAYYDQAWYCNFGNGTSTGYYAVTQWAATTAIAAGALRRQLAAPSVGNERVFVCIVAGTTGGAEPAWTVTRGARTTDNTVTWQECTGASAVNGDLTNTPTWSAAHAINTAVTLGAIIQRNNGASYWICSTAGTMGGSEPAWPNNTAGTTQTDGTVTWTCLGVVGNFTGGQAPHARLANACALNWFAAGNTVYVGDNHAETQTTAITVNPACSYATVSKIICHNHLGSYPPAAIDLTTTATVSTTAGASVGIQANNGTLYIYGLTFSAGTTSNFVNCSFTSIASVVYCDTCVFKIGTAGTSGCFIQLNTSSTQAGAVIWNNCKVGFAATAQYIAPGHGNFVWRNTGQVLASGSSVPTSLIAQNAASYFADVLLEALDLSQVASVFGIPAGEYSTGNWVVKDCKLNASVTFPTPLNSGQVIQTVRADNGATAYKSARYAYDGTETTETSITRVGGASDPTGQAQSRKIATTANSQWLRPFKAEEYAIWNPTTAANVTVTLYGTINAGALPNNDDIWMEVEYLGSASFPTGTIVNTTKANLQAANAPVASDGSSWNGGGSGAGWSPFKLTTTLSSPQPGMAGVISARVLAAKPSTTFYIDPQITLT